MNSSRFRISRSSRWPVVLWGFDPIAYQPASAGGYTAETKVELITANGSQIMVIDRRGAKAVTTPQTRPMYKMQPEEVLRLRILNGTDGLFLLLTMPGLEVYVIGQDGIILLKPARAAERT